ncbi:MAG: choice-of-anchor D domain-containing protein [bacterium]|nr:choice-of-anchor D domain-containing protein [bacterium]
MAFIFVLFFSMTACFAQSFPPDSVWTFAFDDGGDEYFYDAIEVEDGYLLCGEAREWNALVGEALLVKIDREGDLVWSRRYPHERNRRFKRILRPYVSVELAGEYVAPNSQANGLFFLSVLDGDSITGYDPGYTDGRQQQLAHFSNFFNEEWTFIYSARSSDTSSAIVLETWTLSDSSRQVFATSTLNECRGVVYSFDGEAFYGRRTNPQGHSDGFVLRRNMNNQYDYETFGGDQSDDFRASVRHYPDSVICFVGGTYSYSHGGSDLWLEFVNVPLLETSQTRHYGGLSYEDGVEVVNAEDSGYIIAGNFSSEDIEFEQSDFWLLKVDDDGDSVWSVLAGGAEADRCDGMIETENGFLLYGASQSFSAPGWDGCAMLIEYVPDLVAVPSTLNFGPVAVGDSTMRTLNLINSGSNTLTVNSLSGAVAYHAQFSGPVTIAVGDTLAVSIYFAPTTAGTQIDTLTVASDALSGEKNVRCLGAGSAADADERPLVPTEFALYPPYPNPFNAQTVIEFDLAHESDVKLDLYDATGRLARTVLDDQRGAGAYRVTLNANGLASGSYFVTLTAGQFHATQKVLVVK